MGFAKRLVLCIWLAAVAGMAGATLVAQDSRQAQAQLRAARQLEEVAGDLAGAMDAYRKLSTSADRTVAAEALLRLAGCQEKLGLAEVRKTYEQLIARFADQAPIVAEARRRLAAESMSDRMGQAVEVQRTLATLGAPYSWPLGPVSHDGRWLVYKEISDPKAILLDLVRGVRRPLDCGGPGSQVDQLTRVVFSNDDRQLACLVRLRPPSGPPVWQLRVIDMAGASSRVLSEATRSDRGYAEVRSEPYAWTADGQWIAVRHKKDADTQQIALLSTVDGSMRVLKTLAEPPTVGIFRAQDMFLSPDNRYLAAEVDEGGVTRVRDIVILPLDGGPETQAVLFRGDDRLMGWSPDGQAILFTSERSGDSGLWSQRVAAGRLQGEATLVRPGYSASFSLGLTGGGNLYSFVEDGPEFRIKQARFDFSTGTVTANPTDMQLPFVGSNQAPRWSPDGRWLAYLSARPAGGRVLTLYSSDSGVSRDLAQVSFRNNFWNWMPDSQALIGLNDRQGEEGYYRIDVRTGAMTRLSASSYRNGSPLPEWSADRRTVLFDRPGAKGEPAIRIAVDAATGTEREVGPAGARLSLDGTKTYTTTSIAGGQVIVERDVRSGTAREVLRRYPERGTWELTPDGTAIVATSTDPVTKQSLVLHCTLADGSVRTLLRMPAVANARLAIVGQRDNSVVVQWNERFWWTPLDGRPSKHLTELDGLRYFSLHPEGRQLALDVRAEPRSGGQVYVLENFLPVTKR